MIDKSLNKFQIISASAGSGKTFFITKEYLSLILSSDNPFKFREILCMTFTNKAAGEMKERILLSLFKCTEINKNEKDPLVSQIIKEVNLSKKIIQNRATKSIKTILHNYSYFSIMTIDKFSLRILRSFSKDLSLPYAFEVTIEQEKALKNAINNLFQSIGNNSLITKYLLGFLQINLENENSWDITKLIFEHSKVLFSEEIISHQDQLDSYDLKNISKVFSNIVIRQKKLIKTLQDLGKKAISIIDNINLSLDSFAYGSRGVGHYFANIMKYEHIVMPNNNVKKTIINNNWAKGNISDEEKTKIDSIKEDLNDIFQKIESLIHNFRNCYILDSIVKKNLNSYGLLSTVQKSLNNYTKQHSLILISEFNKIIFNEIKNNPTPFIYERIGNKFKTFMIDEFQDTSWFQFQNILPLLKETTDKYSIKNGRVYLVGDAKQAIYRWRGSIPEMFIKYINDKEHNILELTTNYRSKRRLVEFTNQLFTKISNTLDSKPYTSLYKRGCSQNFVKSQEGYVEIKVYDNNSELENWLTYTQKIIEDCVERNYDYRDIAILVRRNSEAQIIADFLQFFNIPILSQEAFLLRDSNKIQILIKLLIWYNNPNKWNFIQFFELLIDNNIIIIDNQTDIFYLLKTIKVFNLIEGLKVLQDFGIDLFELPNLNSCYERCIKLIETLKWKNISDIYLVQFLNIIFEFEKDTKNFGNSFIDYWNEYESTLKLPEIDSANAVQIMTIHKSKGLEFPIVIIPFATWDYRREKQKFSWFSLPKDKYFPLKSIYLKIEKSLNEVDIPVVKEAYRSICSHYSFDTMNLLYVATTRAKEELYISTMSTTYPIPAWLNDFDFSCNSSTWKSGKKSSNKRKEILMPSVELKIIASVPKMDTVVSTDDYKEYNLINEAIVKGMVIHEILSDVETIHCINIAINNAITKGLIKSNNKKYYTSLLQRIVSHHSVEFFFMRGNLVRNECEIVTEKGNVLRPDKLVFQGKKVHILEYKTGIKNKTHEQQIKKYDSQLRKAGYLIGKKAILYIHENQIQVKNVQ